MDKKIKDLIADNKLSDDQILSALQGIKPAEQPPATEGTKAAQTPAIEETKKAAQTPAIEETKTADPSLAATNEKPSGKMLSLTPEEFEKMVAAKVQETINNLPKEQPFEIPTIENKKRPAQWKKIEMKK